MGIFSAYRVPGCAESIYPAITPINGTRAVTSCALGTALDPLPDLNYWIAGNGEGEAIPVAVAAND